MADVTFALTGARRGAAQDAKLVTVTWTDGNLSGDDDAVKWLELLAQECEGRTIRPFVGPMTTTNHLNSPYSAYMLMRSIFQRTPQPKLTGALPEIDMPPGAIS